MLIGVAPEVYPPLGAIIPEVYPSRQGSLHTYIHACEDRARWEFIFMGAAPDVHQTLSETLPRVRPSRSGYCQRYPLPESMQ